MSAADYVRKAALKPITLVRDINFLKPKQQAVTDTRVLPACVSFFS